MNLELLNALLALDVVDAETVAIMRGTFPSLPPVPADGEITELDIELAIQVWDEVLPNYAGLLEATIE